MDNRIDRNCNLPIGTRDAIHIPIVTSQVSWNPKGIVSNLLPGSFVKFVDETFTKFILCEKDEAHRILNPFLDEISSYDNVVVFLMPNITTPVRHHFDINPNQKKWEKDALELELEAAKSSDPGCADCYEIQNSEIVRM